MRSEFYNRLITARSLHTTVVIYCRKHFVVISYFSENDANMPIREVSAIVKSDVVLTCCSYAVDVFGIVVVCLSVTNVLWLSIKS